jgi:two-component system phosphate regulon sensor histidine kinase PhoR
MPASLRLRIGLGYLAVVAVVAAVLAGTGSIAAAAIAGLAASALLTLAAAATLSGQLRRLATAARSIGAGDLGKRISPRPDSEAGDVADAFNQMAAAIEERITAASQERNRLVAALNSSADAVLAVDEGGRIAFANVAAERLFDRAQADLIGQPFSWVMPHEQVLEALRASRDEGQGRPAMIEQPGRRYLQVITTPIVGGGEWAALVVCHDISEVKRTEQVRRDFVANVSHELRTPLASVKSVIDTLQGGALEDETAAREFLARADAEIDRMVQIMEELLELSRIESGEMPLATEPVELSAVLGRAVERLRLQAERQRVELRLELAPGLPQVIGDAERLERVALSLIHNALKFTPAGGSVRVRAACDDGRATVEVADTGAGISPQDLPRVFERFYKADRARSGAGTGLGLAIVKHTVEAHGGTVTVASDEGRGSTFTVSLPAAPPAHD